MNHSRYNDFADFFDESTKGNKAMVAKNYECFNPDGFVDLRTAGRSIEEDSLTSDNGRRDSRVSSRPKREGRSPAESLNHKEE